MGCYKDVDVVNKLKQNIIKDFEIFICELRSGYRPKQEHILEEISLIDIYDQNLMEKNQVFKLIQYYLNDKQHSTFSSFL